MNKKTTPHVLALLTALSLGAGVIRAQSAPENQPATSQDQTKAEDETIVLSPFVVSSAEDKGYKATATLAGSRVRTDLKDIASSISVVTSEFLKDTGATNNQSLLQYTTNTEVGGLYGNYAGVGGTFVEGAAESATNFVRPATNTRVRGLDSADNTRDLFLTDIPWDSFNVGRVDLQRGPNSILFGIGSPAGIINTSVNTAGYKTEGQVENRISSFGSVRDSFDYNHVLIPHQLAVRVSGLYDHTKYRQEPAYNLDRRLFGAARWDPQLVENGRTSIRVNYEHGSVRANRPRTLPPVDRLTPFFDADKINKQFVDGWYATTYGIAPFSSSSLYPGMKANFWLSGNMGPFKEGSNPVFYYDNSATPMTVRQGTPNGQFAIGADGNVSGALNGFPYGSALGIASYNTYANNVAQFGASHGATPDQIASVAGATSGFYKSKSITDPTIFDFYNTLIDGPTKKEWQDWEAYNLSFEQTFFDDRLGFQAVYDRQHYTDGHEQNLGYDAFLSIDILENTMQYPWAYTDLVVKNPNAGRVFTGSNSKGGGGSRSTDRENLRFTAFGELRASDFLDRSRLLTRILGHHTITGLYSEERYDTEERAWARYAATEEWADRVGTGFLPGGSQNGGIRGESTPIDNIVYLTDSVVGAPGASGLNIPGIKFDQSPSGTYAAKYFDSHWKWPLDPANPNYVDPAAPWNDPTTRPDGNPAETQSNNPHNLVGWQDTTVTILNADKGDIDSLYTDGSKIRRKTTSEGLTWQAYLWDDVVVGTVGLRRDRQEQRAGFAPTDKYGVASMDYGLGALDPTTGISTGTSTSWGIVLHTPRAIRDRLPWGTDVSLAYSDGKNTRVENRYGFDASILPNAKGHTRDYSLAISTLNDRLTFKATYYKTEVTDANIASVTTATTTLGANSGSLANLEAWGIGSALMDLAGIQGYTGGGYAGMDWYWNWANIDAGYPGGDLSNVNSDAFKNNPSTIKEKAAIQSWLDQMQPQQWFDAFGYSVDVAKAKAGDWAHAIKGGAWQPQNYVGDVANTPGGGRINGSWPTGTVNNESKGWEFEVVGQPTKNWNVSFNASKQTASQVALGSNLVDFLEALHAKYETPAGDLRLWWGGDTNLRTVFNRDVYSAYLFQKETNGKMVPEMSPWRFNLVTNYKFDRGLLKGFNVGGGYRWQDGKILGYALNQAQDNLDVNKPFWSKSEDWVDLWAGYERDIRSGIRWRIQLNLRNVGENPHLSPISIQPDGSGAQYRIEEGMAWTLTNTFSF